MEPVVIELETVAARPRQGLRRVLGALTMGLFVAGVVGVIIEAPDHALTAKEELARLQAFVDEAKTAHFVADSRTESKDGKGDLGSSYRDHSRAEGELVVSDRSHMIGEDGEYAYEAITLATGSYYREADDRAGLAGEQWLYEAHSDTPLPTVPTPSAMSSGPIMTMATGVASALGGSELAELLDAAGSPVRVSANTIKVVIDVKRLPDFSAQRNAEGQMPLPTITAELTSGSADRLERLVLTTAETYPGDSADDSPPGSFISTEDVRFSQWGAPVTIAAPPANQVDPTPGIDEKDLKEFVATALVGLRRLPAGYELVEAGVFTSVADAAPEDGECPEVDLSYADPAAVDAFMASVEADPTAPEPASIDVELTPASCDYMSALTDGDPIRLGPMTGTVVRGEDLDEDYRTSIEVIVGTTRVDIYSDRPEAATVAAASDLIPFDLATQPVHRVAPPT
jgi:hypothetical protein